MRTIRASEIGSFVYCRRAWKYRHEGVASENAAEMAAGTAIHHQHGRTVLAAGFTRGLGKLLLAGAILLLFAHFAGQVL